MKLLDRAESSLVEIASKTGPILAPIPTAYLVGAATIEHLAWPWPVGVVAAVVVECLGLASTGLALDLYDYKKSKRKSDPPAPFGLSLAIVAAYFITALALTVALDIVPEQARYAPAIFPALSLCGVTILAIRIGHRERLAEIEREKAKARQKRDEKKSEPDRTVTGQQAASVLRWPDKAAFMADTDHPAGLTTNQLAELAGIKLRTARRWRKDRRELIAARSDNGRE